MNTDLPSVNRIRNARDALRTATQRGVPVLIKIPLTWIARFQSLSDVHLFVPVHPHSEGVLFWGVPVLPTDTDDNEAVVVFADKKQESVRLVA